MSVEKKYARAVLWAGAAVCGVLALAAAVLAMAWGADGTAWPAALAGAVCGIWLPGVFWREAAARFLRAEDFARRAPFCSAFFLGSGFFAVESCVAFRFGARWLLAAGTALFAALGLWTLWCRRKADAGRDARALAPALWLLALLLGLFLLVWVPFTAHPQAVGITVLKQDFLWNVGNANSFLMGFPPEDIRFSGVRLQYHYLTELLCAGVSLLTGADPFDLLGGAWPALFLTAAVLCCRELGLWLYGEARAANLLAACVFLLDAQMLYHQLTNVNAVATATVYACIWLLLTDRALRRAAGPGPADALLGVCGAVMLCFAKGPTGLLLTLALFAALAWLTLMRRASLRLWLWALAQGAVVLAVYRIVFSSGANNMTFSPDATLVKTGAIGWLDALGRIHPALYWALLPVGMLVFIAVSRPWTCCYFACVPSAVRRLPRMQGTELVLHAGIWGGMAAFFLFDHYAMSQIYFLFLAFLLMAVFLAPRLSVWRARRRAAAVVLCALGFGVCVWNFAPNVADGLQRCAQNAGLVEKSEEMDVLPATEQAGLWLRENMADDEIFAVNRYNDSASAEGNSNLYSAFSGRQAFMEGWLYAVSNMGLSQEAVDERFVQNAVLFSPKSSPQTVLDTARACGVDYLVFDEEFAYSAGENGPQFALLELVFTAPGVQIYRVPPV